MDVSSDGGVAPDDVAEEGETLVGVRFDVAKRETTGEREEGRANGSEILLLVAFRHGSELHNLLDEVGRQAGR